MWAGMRNIMLAVSILVVGCVVGDEVTDDTAEPTTEDGTQEAVVTYGLTVASVAMDSFNGVHRNQVPGMFVTLETNGTTVARGYTPVTFTVKSGVRYTVTVARSYQNIVFDHWGDNYPYASTSPSLTVTPTGDGRIKAYYWTSKGAIWGLYSNPTRADCSTCLSRQWQAVVDAKRAHPDTPVIVAVNPCNGPGSETNPQYAFGIDQLRRAGVIVAGYVYTKYANNGVGEACRLSTGSTSSCSWNRVNYKDDNWGWSCSWRLWDSAPSSTYGVGIKQDIARWKQFYPEGLTNGRYGVNAIFFDEMHYPGIRTTDDDAANASWYRNTLTAYAKSQGFDLTIGNPGADSGPTHIGATDIIMIYERAGLPTWGVYPDSLPDRRWQKEYDRHNFGMIPFRVSPWSTALRDWVQQTKSAVGYIYITDDPGDDGNPWDTVSSYLGQLLDTLAR
jgi:hypothetical protein